MRKPVETAVFGGCLHVRSGWFWVPAHPEDFEQEYADAAKRELRWWLASFALAALAAVCAVLKSLIFN